MVDEIYPGLHEDRRIISRRLLFQSAAAIAGGFAALISMGLPAVAKMSQQSAGYLISPKDKGDQSCATCALFQTPSSCSLIDGTISPTGWCRFYAKKAAP